MNPAPTGKPAAAAEAAPRTANARPDRRPGSALHRVLKRIVAFVIPPDDKIAQTWRWLL